MKNRWGIWHYHRLVEHLQEMSQQGWLLESYSESTLGFVSTEAKRRHFAVIFFTDYDYLDSEIPEKLQDLWQMCEADGWHHITENSAIQIFYSEEENPIPLQTDGVVQLENFHSMINLLKLKQWRQDAVINGVSVLALGVISAVFLKDLSIGEFMSRLSVMTMLLAAFWIYRFVSSVCGLADYYSWYGKAKKAACKDGVFIVFQPNVVLENTDTAVGVFFIGGMLIHLVKSGEIASFFVFLIPMALLIFAVVASMKLMKKKGVSADDNRTATAIIAVVLILLFVMSLPYIFMAVADMGIGGDFITVTTTYPK